MFVYWSLEKKKEEEAISESSASFLNDQND